MIQEYKKMNLQFQKKEINNSNIENGEKKYNVPEFIREKIEDDPKNLVLSSIMSLKNLDFLEDPIFHQVEVLDLSECRNIKCFEGLKYLPNLISLDLSETDIFSLPSEYNKIIFKNLRFLYLKGTNFLNINFIKIPNIIELDIKKTNITILLNCFKCKYFQILHVEKEKLDSIKFNFKLDNQKEPNYIL